LVVHLKEELLNLKELLNVKLENMEDMEIEIDVVHGTYHVKILKIKKPVLNKK